MKALLIVLAAALLVAHPAASREKTTYVANAANAANAEFHARNGPFVSTGSVRRVPYRTLRVVITAVSAKGAVEFAVAKRDAAGTLDLLGVPELIAQDAKQFGGRKALEASDLEVGQRLKITYRGDTGEVLKVKVLRPRS